MWKSDAGIERSEIDFVTTDVLLELESVFPFFSVSVENIRDKTILKQRKRIYKGRGGVRMWHKEMRMFRQWSLHSTFKVHLSINFKVFILIHSIRLTPFQNVSNDNDPSSSIMAEVLQLSGR